MKKTVWNDEKLKALDKLAREGKFPTEIGKILRINNETVRKKMSELGLVGLTKKKPKGIETDTKRNIRFDDVCKIYRRKYKVGGKFKYNGKLHKIKQVCQWQLVLDRCVTVSFADMYVSDCLRMG